MPSYIITCKEDASPEQVEAVKKHARDQGGKIEREFKIIKGFSYVPPRYCTPTITTLQRTRADRDTSVSFDDGTVTTLENNEHVKGVELDGVMKTQ
ncbi:hypothetical protein ACO1O0_004545 [Amphichorda felina]